MIYYIGYGCVQEQTSYLKDSTGGALYWLDGRSLTFDRYQSVSWFSGSDQLLCGSYLVGNRYLYDLLDTDGNVLMEGLNDYYSYTADPDGFMMVRKGFSYGLLDADCSWLWKESIFQSAADETDNY
jgi:hypothetical protein